MHSLIILYINMYDNFVPAITYCDAYPCKHGATCRDQIGGFNCDCVYGYTGGICETGADIINFNQMLPSIYIYYSNDKYVQRPISLMCA